jgi:hypothetical protein
MFGDEHSYASTGCRGAARIDPWQTPAYIRRRATYDEAYAAWVEAHAPAGTERAIQRALEDCVCGCRSGAR